MVKIKKGSKPYILLFPALAIILLFKVYPIVFSVYKSFFKTAKGGIEVFCWLENYAKLFSMESFRQAIAVTLKFALITTPIQVVLAVGVALLVNRNRRSIRFLRTLVYIPVAINMVLASTIWNMMLNPSYGIVNTLLGKVGIDPQPFLTSERQALYSVILICCWKGVSYWVMFLLSGLQNISTSIYEAGYLDGTTPWTQFWYLTLPMMRNSLIFVFISDSMINLFMFVPMYMLTKGGPQGSTSTLMYQAYTSAFKYSNYGQSYAIVCILLVITMVIVALQFFLTREKN